MITSQVIFPRRGKGKKAGRADEGLKQGACFVRDMKENNRIRIISIRVSMMQSGVLMLTDD
jgi:hypothetical protein